MTYYRDNGVVLRTQKLGEADRIVTVLTRRHGRVRLAAKGVRRTSSRFGARLEPFSHIDDRVSTGSTLKANKLVEVERIMDISSRLVVNQAALKLKRERIRSLIAAFAGAIPATA